MAADFRTGLIGLGNLGQNVLAQLEEKRADRSHLYWVADSSRVVSRRDGGTLSPSEMATIRRAKGSRQGLGSLPGRLLVSTFGSAREEAGTLAGLMEHSRESWVVLDSTYLDAERSRLLASSFMGVLGFCTANKTPWADSGMCRALFSQAQRERTFLGLNCTQGVWIDQMEYIPVAATRLGGRTIKITKRDNSSLNLLFGRASEGLSSEEIYRELSEGGYLEPGGTDLLPEIKDQQIKAKITANVCSIVGGLSLRSREQSTAQILASGPASASVDDLRAWHVSGRGRGFPALVTEMELDGGSGSVTYELSFRVLDRKHPLGRNFQGANTFSIALPGPEGSEKSFTHRGGPGGSANTARRLMREAEEVVRLSGLRSKDSFNPIPVLAGLAAGDARTTRATRTLLEVLE